MQLKGKILVLVILPSLALLSGCATKSTPPAFPHGSEAKKYYASGAEYLLAGRYEKAAIVLNKSLQLEPEPYSTRVRLGIAYYASEKYSKAVRAFEALYISMGGPSEAAGFAILYALTLRKAGRVERAEQLLKEWSSPDIQSAGTTWINVESGKLPGWSKLLAKYFLGDVTAQDVLNEAPEDLTSYAILFIGMENNYRGNTEAAKQHYQAVLDAVGRDSWRFALATVEMRRIDS